MLVFCLDREYLRVGMFSVCVSLWVVRQCVHVQCVQIKPSAAPPPPPPPPPRPSPPCGVQYSAYSPRSPEVLLRRLFRLSR